MNRYLIQRSIPDAASLSPAQLQAIAQKSNEVLADLAGRAQWLESFIVGDGLCCVYLAADEEVLREHARRGGFPVDAIHEVHGVIDPTTASHQRVAA
jgi:hypothetical protein